MRRTFGLLLAAISLQSIALAHGGKDHGNEAPRAPIEVANAGFEADGTGVAAPQGWTSTGTTTAAFTEGGGHSGGFRLVHYAPADFDVETTQGLRAAQSGLYTL